MTRPFRVPVVRRLRRLAERPAGTGTADRELLERLANNSDREAATAIIQRHGAAVRAVCQRVLGPGPDADDAFQATFLVMLRKASSIRKQDSLGSWLYGVALRVARRAKAKSGMRPAPSDGGQPLLGDTGTDAALREVSAIVDEEVDRLPEKYRTAVVACYFDGLTGEQAAAQLCVPLRTLARRLEQARELLRGRLARRGVGISTALLAGWLGQAASRASVPEGLANSTADAVQASVTGTTGAVSPQVTALAEGIRLGFSLGKWKLAVVASAAVALLGSGYLIGRQIFRDDVGPPSVEAKPDASQQANSKPAEHADSRPRFDRYGDPLPAGAVARLGTMRFHFQDTIYGLAITRDGSLIAVGAGRTRRGAPQPGIRIWDRHTGKEVRSIVDGRSGVSLAFSPDGKLLASAGASDPIVRLFDVQSGKLVDTLQGYEKRATRAVFSPDGKLLATQGDGDAIRLWEVAGGRLLRQMRGGYMAFSPDGTEMAALADAHPGQQVCIWETRTGEKVFSAKITRHTPCPPVLSVESRFVLLSGPDRLAGVRWLDRRTGKKTFQVRGWLLAGTPDGRRAAILDKGVIQTWDILGSKKLGVAASPINQTLPRAAYAGDGRTLVVADGSTVRVLNTRTGRDEHLVPGHTAHVGFLAFTDGGTRLISGDYWNICTWDPTTARQIGCFRPSSHGLAAAALGKGHTLLTVGSNDLMLRIWDAAEQKEISRFEQRPEWQQEFGLSPHGDTLAAVTLRNGQLRLWDAATGHELGRFVAPVRPPGDYGQPCCFVFSPGGSNLGTFSSSGTLAFWDVPGRRLLWCARGAPWPGLGALQSNVLTFSPDGRLVAAPWRSNGIGIWESRTGTRVGQLQGASGHPVWALAFSPMGRVLASGEDDGTIRLWDTWSGQEIRHFRGHLGGVTALAFSPDGGRLASGSLDTTILVWAVAGQRRAGALESAPLSAAELEKLWGALADTDASTAYKAVWKLASAAPQSVPFLLDRITATRQRLARAIRDLDSQRFSVRRRAYEQLVGAGHDAEEALRLTLEEAPSVEVRQRAKEILARLRARNAAPSGGRASAALRAVATLEAIGTPAAGKALRELAQGSPKAQLTREARAALARLRRYGRLAQ